MKNIFFLPLAIGFVFLINEQLVAQFAPPAGQSGSEAIHADSSVFIAWGDSVVIHRGWVKIGEPDLGLASFGDDAFALGKADLFPVSLGDGGSATYFFDPPLRDGDGPDFAVFENSFSDDFLELAHIEVSSDGNYFARFPSVSFTSTDVQVNSFGTIDARHVDLLAGKYRGFYGTPFDISRIADEMINKNQITAVRVIDVVGSIQPDLGSTDASGRLINDPWPTPFPSSGFDLDGIGIIHRGELGLNEVIGSKAVIFPNPFKNDLHIRLPEEDILSSTVVIFNHEGVAIVKKQLSLSQTTFDLSYLSSGIYQLTILGNKRLQHFKIIKM